MLIFAAPEVNALVNENEVIYGTATDWLASSLAAADSERPDRGSSCPTGKATIVAHRAKGVNV